MQIRARILSTDVIVLKNRNYSSQLRRLGKGFTRKEKYCLCVGKLRSYYVGGDLKKKTKIFSNEVFS